MAEPAWLDDEEDRAWRGWLAMSGKLRSRVERDLQNEFGLSSPDFAVLVHLSEIDGSRMRMTDLAEALGWSKSRISHQCSRMQARGLVAREGCPEDARSSYAVLTPCGRNEITRAAPRHVESVRRHFLDLLDREQVRALATITATVLTHLEDGSTAVDDECGTGLPPCPTRAQVAPADGLPAIGLPADGLTPDGSGPDSPFSQSSATAPAPGGFPPSGEILGGTA